MLRGKPPRNVEARTHEKLKFEIKPSNTNLRRVAVSCGKVIRTVIRQRNVQSRIGNSDKPLLESTDGRNCIATVR